MNRHKIIGNMSWLLCSSLACIGAEGAVCPGDATDGVSGATPVYDGNTVPSVTVRDLRWFFSGQAGRQAAFVDARFPGYIGREKLPGALFLNTKTSEETIRRRLPDPNQLIVVYCSDRNCPAGYWMAERLFQMGYTRVSEYPGGMAEWVENKGATEPVEPKNRGDVEKNCSGATCLIPPGPIHGDISKGRSQPHLGSPKLCGDRESTP